MGCFIQWSLPMDFPARLIQLRHEKALTQQALADAVGIHVNQIRRYEAGQAQPTLEALIKLAKKSMSAWILWFSEKTPEPEEEFRLRFEALKTLPWLKKMGRGDFGQPDSETYGQPVVLHRTTNSR